MSGKSVRDLTIQDAQAWLNDELSWFTHYDSKLGWILGVHDDGGDVRQWRVETGKVVEEL